MQKPINFIPSASVILLRESGSEIEVLLLQKNKAITFGGSWVFPGGRIDGIDIKTKNSEHYSSEKNAVSRECEEETGLELDKDKLIATSEWTTPVFRPKRFRTLFFLYDAGLLGKSVKIDHGEIVDWRWTKIDQALSLHQSKEIVLAGPAFVLLSQLSHFSSIDQALDHFREREIKKYAPRVHLVENGAICLYEGDDWFDHLDMETTSTSEQTTRELQKSGRQHRLYMNKTKPWVYIDTNRPA